MESIQRAITTLFYTSLLIKLNMFPIPDTFGNGSWAQVLKPRPLKLCPKISSILTLGNQFMDL